MTTPFSPIQVGETVLVTCDNWFLAPDGRQYRGVFGSLRAVHTAEDVLGVKPNARSTNWYVEVGNMLIAGCQVHYAIKADSCNLGPCDIWNTHDGTTVTSQTPAQIYNADGGTP